MSTSTSSFVSIADGTKVVTYDWTDVAGTPAGVVQIAHGLAEHGERYERFAKELNAAGFLVHAVDHRGHGRTANGRLGDFGPAGFAGLIADVVQYGAAISGLPPYPRPVNTVFQSYALFPHLSVARNIAFGLEMLGRPKAEVAETVDRMLAMVKMAAMRLRTRSPTG